MGELVATLTAGVAQGMPLFIVATGLTLIFGVLRVLNFAHGAFFMFGAFVLTTVLGGGSPGLGMFVVAALAAAMAVAGIGVLSEVTVFRRLYHREHLVTLLASYALLLFLEGLATQIWGVNPKTQRQTSLFAGSFEVLGIRLAVYDVVLVLLGLVIGAGLLLLLRHTQYGQRVTAVATDEVMARALGVRARRVQISVFALGAGLAGLSGALMAPLVSIDAGLAPSFVIQAFAVVIIGGLGSIGGALAAALIIGVSESILVSYLPELAGFSLYIAVALVLVLRPQGIAGQRATPAEVG